MPPGGKAYKLGGNNTWRKEVSGQNGKVAGMVSENPAPGVKGAKKSEDEKFSDKLWDKQAYTGDCVRELFPEVQDLEPLADDFGYDLLIDDEVIGTVIYAYWVNYGTGNRKFYWSTNREICQQVRKARREWLKARKERFAHMKEIPISGDQA